MLFRKLKQSVQEQRAQERAVAAAEVNRGLIEYVAIMADVELPEEDNAESEVADYE